jgi:hypothetical protein
MAVFRPAFEFQRCKSAFHNRVKTHDREKKDPGLSKLHMKEHDTICGDQQAKRKY